MCSASKLILNTKLSNYKESKYNIYILHNKLVGTGRIYYQVRQVTDLASLVR